MKNISKISLLILMLCNFICLAQPGDEDNNGGLEGNDPAPTPINGKLILLALAGILYAIYLYKNHYKKQA